MMQDWHVHNFVSHDAKGHVRDFVEAGIAKGVDIILFANHPERMCPFDNVFKIDIELVTKKLRLEREEIEKCRDIFGDKIRIFQGIELENRKTLLEINKKLLDSYEFDIVIGSCHLVGESSISSKRNLKIFENQDEETLYQRFFDGTTELLNCFPFDILGHFDIVKRFGVYYYGTFRPEKYEDRIDEIFEMLKTKRIGMEINTSGFFQGPEEPYPSEDLAMRALKKGVPFVVTGSDSHKPEDLAHGFENLKNKNRYNTGHDLLFKKDK